MIRGFQILMSTVLGRFFQTRSTRIEVAKFANQRILRTRTHILKKKVFWATNPEDKIHAQNSDQKCERYRKNYLEYFVFSKYMHKSILVLRLTLSVLPKIGRILWTNTLFHVPIWVFETPKSNPREANNHGRCWLSVCSGEGDRCGRTKQNSSPTQI